MLKWWLPIPLWSSCDNLPSSSSSSLADLKDKCNTINHPFCIPMSHTCRVRIPCCFVLRIYRSRQCFHSIQMHKKYANPFLKPPNHPSCWTLCDGTKCIWSFQTFLSLLISACAPCVLKYTYHIMCSLTRCVSDLLDYSDYFNECLLLVWAQHKCHVIRLTFRSDWECAKSDFACKSNKK